MAVVVGLTCVPAAGSSGGKAGGGVLGHVPAPGQQVQHLVSAQPKLQGEQPNRILMDHPTSRRKVQPKLIMGLPGSWSKTRWWRFLSFFNPGAGQGLPSWSKGSSG